MTIYTTDLLDTLRVRPSATPTIPLVFETSMEEQPQGGRDQRSFPITGQLATAGATSVTPSERYHPFLQPQLGWTVRCLRVYNPNPDTVIVDIGRYHVPGDATSTFLVLWQANIKANGTMTLDREGVLSVTDPFSSGASTPLEYKVEMQRGNIEGHRGFYKYGLVDMGTGSSGNDHDVWDRGANGDYPVYPYLATASVLDVYSSSTDDDVGGTGVDEIKIDGVDTNWDLLTETVTLDGTTSVQTTKSFLRVYRASTTGPNNVTPRAVNVGDIDIEANSTGDPLARIAAGNGRTFQTHMVVPNGKRGYIYTADINMAGKSSGVVVVKMLASQDRGPWLTTEVVAVSGSGGETVTTLEYPMPYGGIPARSDIKFVANPDSNSLAVAVSYEISWIDDDAPV